MQCTVAEIAEYLEADFHGDGACLITSMAPLHLAKEGQAAFLDKPRYRHYLATTQASVVILAKSDFSNCPTNAIVVDNPHVAYAKVSQLFKRIAATPKNPFIHPTALIGKNCQIASDVSIGAYSILQENVVIAAGVTIGSHCSIGENCKIGAGSFLYDGVCLYNEVEVGEKALLHAGAVIGADSFGFAQSEYGWVKVEHFGAVKIGHNVEIGANTTIDRGSLLDTIISDGVKIDNQVQIGHNVFIGEHTVIAGCVAVGGSTRIGKYCMIGGGTCVADHIVLHDRVVITGMSAVAHSLEESGVYSSSMPVDSRRSWQKNVIHFRHLKELVARVRRLESFFKSLKLG